MTDSRHHEVKLIDEATLERSSTVANCTMNRQRDLTGTNGYGKELGIDPIQCLMNSGKNRSEHEPGRTTVRWLDLCCGTGRALVQAVELIASQSPGFRVAITGVDLVDSFDAFDEALRGGKSADSGESKIRDSGESKIRDFGESRVSLTFVETSLATWDTAERFDLITCVHGLHYIGDKLGLIGRATTWLLPNGILVANLDTTSIKIDNESGNRRVPKMLRSAGCQYDTRRRLIYVDGQQSPKFPAQFLGADDQAGPNYTGQPAVDSYYRSAKAR